MNSQGKQGRRAIPGKMKATAYTPEKIMGEWVKKHSDQ